MTIRKFKKKCKKFFGRKNVYFKRWNNSLWMRHRISEAYSDKFGWDVDCVKPNCWKMRGV
jgi:hypothetical protein